MKRLREPIEASGLKYERDRPTEAASIIGLLSSGLPFCTVAEAPRYWFLLGGSEIDADGDVAAL